MVINGQIGLSPKRNFAIGQLELESLLVDRFQKTAPEPFVNFERSPNDLISLIIDQILNNINNKSFLYIALIST